MTEITSQIRRGHISGGDVPTAVLLCARAGVIAVVIADILQAESD